MPTENILSWSPIAMDPADAKFVLTTEVIIPVVKATIVVVTAMSALHMKASNM